MPVIERRAEEKAICTEFRDCINMLMAGNLLIGGIIPCLLKMVPYRSNNSRFIIRIFFSKKIF